MQQLCAFAGSVRMVTLQGTVKNSRRMLSELHFDCPIDSIGIHTLTRYMYRILYSYMFSLLYSHTCLHGYEVQYSSTIEICFFFGIKTRFRFKNFVRD